MVNEESKFLMFVAKLTPNRYLQERGACSVRGVYGAPTAAAVSKRPRPRLLQRLPGGQLWVFVIIIDGAG